MNNEYFEKALNWLADAPMFIDPIQVDRFFDAVVKPDGKIAQVTKSIEGKETKEHGTEGTGEVQGGIIGFITGKVSAKVQGSTTTTSGATDVVVFEMIDTPQRQLIELVKQFQHKYQGRLYYVDDSRNSEWRDIKTILNIPRAIVFLDLPSQIEASKRGLPTVKLIPTAAEFENGRIVPIFPELRAENGENPPLYPEKPRDNKSVEELRKEYWAWFDKNYIATRAMITVEKAASENGRIRWIDYRLPITNNGDTLHLHIQPAGQYDTGVFAYNLIKRGFKHGLRLVGTMKSEPDMNVLAIYEK